MVRYRVLLLGVAACHFVMVALGAASVDLGGPGIAAGMLDGYGKLSGASSTYGFFSPGITFQLGARFDVIDAEGHTTPVALASGASHEADLRVGTIIDRFGASEDEEEAAYVRRALSASLAGKLLARHPEASAVVVHLEAFEPVSMEAFRRGERPQWSPVYDAKFAHRPKNAAEVDDGTHGS